LLLTVLHVARGQQENPREHSHIKPYAVVFIVAVLGDRSDASA
jgi:hypothetical protein